MDTKKGFKHLSWNG